LHAEIILPLSINEESNFSHIILRREHQTKFSRRERGENKAQPSMHKAGSLAIAHAATHKYVQARVACKEKIDLTVLLLAVVRRCQLNLEYLNAKLFTLISPGCSAAQPPTRQDHIRGR
jgi:hypothetical protein